MNEYQFQYLKVWTLAFSQFSNWTEEEVVRWARPLIDAMERPNLVINNTPMFYVARELASRTDHYDQMEPSKRTHLIDALESILIGNGNGWDFPEGYDFLTAKVRVSDLLKN